MFLLCRRICSLRTNHWGQTWGKKHAMNRKPFSESMDFVEGMNSFWWLRIFLVPDIFPYFFWGIHSRWCRISSNSPGAWTGVEPSSAVGMSFISIQQKLLGRKHGRSCFGGLSKIALYNLEQIIDWHHESIVKTVTRRGNPKAYFILPSWFFTSSSFAKFWLFPFPVCLSLPCFLFGVTLKVYVATEPRWVYHPIGEYHGTRSSGDFLGPFFWGVP